MNLEYTQVDILITDIDIKPDIYTIHTRWIRNKPTVQETWLFLSLCWIEKAKIFPENPQVQRLAIQGSVLIFILTV